MMEVVEKVTAFITRERNGVKEVLLFQHPNAGIQIPAGTVDPGEAFAEAVIREGYEETGLEALQLVQYLGTIENELDEGEKVLTEIATIYLEPEVSIVALPANAQSWSQRPARRAAKWIQSYSTPGIRPTPPPPPPPPPTQAALSSI